LPGASAPLQLAVKRSGSSEPILLTDEECGQKTGVFNTQPDLFQRIIRAATRMILQSKIMDVPSSASLTLGTFPQGKAFRLCDKLKFESFSSGTIRAVP
jgi:hypothetical protein